MKRVRWLCLLTVGTLLLTGCAAPGVTESDTSLIRPAPGSPTTESRPADADEMRGVWLSYLDLEPLLKNADPATAAERLNTVMDTCRAWGLNTVFFHVRAHADAYYSSTVYPAAGTVESLLTAGFDPLAYAVTAAHTRGLALHAWINPYRIGNAAPDDTAGGAFQHNGVWYADPSSDTTRKRVLDGVREILQHYAVDGIHFDDYFYPSGLNVAGEEFEAVPAGITVGDWRRTQVDLLVSGVWGLAHRYGRVFGISPAGLPSTCRNAAYADVTGWMRQSGYIDYICPQIYFGFANQKHPYDAVLAEWLAMPRAAGVRLCVGLALYKTGMTDDPYAGSGRAEWATGQDILARQVDAVRNAGTDGFVLFRYQHLFSSPSAELQNLRRRLTAAP